MRFFCKIYNKTIEGNAKQRKKKKILMTLKVLKQKLKRKKKNVAEDVRKRQ